VNDEQLRAAYQKGMTRGRDRSACPTGEQLGAIVDGSASEVERLAVLRHVGGCADCRSDLEILRTAAELAERAMKPWWTSRPVLALAAALVVTVGGVALWQQAGGPPGDDIVRNSPSAAVALVAPAEGAVLALPLRFVWSSVPGAVRYELELLDGADNVVVAGTTPDSVFEVTDSGRLTADGEFRWWVRAVLRDGTQPRSAVRRFRIAASP
jgi:putative zinc finger protein